MRVKVVLVLFILFPSLAACGQGRAQELLAYQYVQTFEYRDESYDIRWKMSFYPDGLIRSVEKMYYDHATRKSHIAVAIRVSRDGDMITQEYTATDSERLLDTTFQIGQEAVVIRKASSAESDIYSLETNEGAASGQQSLAYKKNGQVVYDFEAMDAAIMLSIPYSKRQYDYMMNKRTGLPEVKSGTELSGQIRISRLGQSKYLATRSDTDGPILSSFRIEGDPIKASPLTAALNFLIFPDWIVACTLFPFMGGVPSQ